ncbi:MAG TPA: prepilin-type N-terminal cleavage/methylation domain-containing protein [Polyangiaceae bacterium]|nr:prepilin-type N-terminal cleavage/methylation domain-containing protein [Polyangiaceae bacterium]
MTRRTRTSRRGFTLVEMMVVVIIVGVLAALAVYGVSKYILSAKVGEAVSMMGSIKSAEEAFKGETFIYLDVSTTFDPTNFYPSTTPGRSKVQWGGGSGTVPSNWKTLGVHPDGPVAFSYAVVATKPGDAQPALPTEKTNFNLPTTITAWQYVAVAKADLGGITGRYTYVLSHSYSSDIYVENEGE